MKRLNDEISFEERKRKEVRRSTSQEVIILDERIGSNLLYHKFKYQTSELQLFLQHVPVLFWYPLDIIGTPNYSIDSCIFRAAMVNPLHEYSTGSMVLTMLDTLTDVDNNSHEFLKRIYHLKTIEQNSWRERKLCNLLESLLDYELFVSKVIRYEKNPLEYISDRWRDNENIVLQALKVDNSSLMYVSDRLRNDDEFISKVAKQQTSSSSKAGRETRDAMDDEKAVLYAINRNTCSFECASDRLKDDEQFVLKVIGKHGRQFSYASKRLRNDEQFILKALRANGDVLFCLGQLQDNETIVSEAIKQSGEALRYASERLKDNEQIILQAIDSYGVLEYASDRLKDNEKIVLEAVRHNGCALEYLWKCCSRFFTMLLTKKEILDVIHGFKIR